MRKACLLIAFVAFWAAALGIKDPESAYVGLAFLAASGLVD